MIKLISQVELVRLVHTSDDAVDRGNSDIKKYRETADISHLKFKSGETPTYFYAGALNALQGEELDKLVGQVEFDDAQGGGKVRSFKGEFNEKAKAVEAFRLCIQKIEGADPVRLEGNHGFDTDGKGQRRVSASILKHFPKKIVLEIGKLCLRLNQADEEDEKN